MSLHNPDTSVREIVTLTSCNDIWLAPWSWSTLQCIAWCSRLSYISLMLLLSFKVTASCNWQFSSIPQKWTNQATNLFLHDTLHRCCSVALPVADAQFGSSWLWRVSLVSSPSPAARAALVTRKQRTHPAKILILTICKTIQFNFSTFASL